MAVDVYARVGTLIRNRREALGMTQAQLAAKTGLGRTSITMIEQGAQSLMVHQLIDLASALRTNPMELLPTADTEGEVEAFQDDATVDEIQFLLSGLDKSVHRITR